MAVEAAVDGADVARSSLPVEPAERELGAGRGGEVCGNAPAASGVVSGLAGGCRRGSRAALAGDREEDPFIYTSLEG
jgi:hypothetical protein